MSSTVYPTMSTTVHDVPVIVDITGTNAERNGLQAVTPEDDIPKIDVRLEGNRVDVGNIQSSDVIVKAVVENVNNAEHTSLT